MSGKNTHQCYKILGTLGKQKEIGMDLDVSFYLLREKLAIYHQQNTQSTHTESETMAQALSSKPTVRISSIFIYPIKSCRGISVSQAPITPTGKTNRTQFFIYIYIYIYNSISCSFTFVCLTHFLVVLSVFMNYSHSEQYILCLCATLIGFWVKFSRRDKYGLVFEIE